MIRVVMERDNVNDEFVIVTKIHKRHGEVVAHDDVIIDVETSKTVKEIKAPASGTLHISLQEGDEVPISATLFEVAADSTEQNSQVAPMPGRTEGKDATTAPPIARELSRSAQNLVQSLGVDPDLLPGGWVTAADVATAAKEKTTGAGRPATLHPIRPPEPAPAVPVPPTISFRSERLSMRKRTEARNLARANGHGNLSMLAIHLSAHSSRLINAPFLFQDSITDLVVFESARLLRQYPELNGFLLDDRTVGYYEEVNFGISFDSGQNLKVLSLRNADVLPLPDIQAGIENLLHLYESGATIEENLLSTSTVTLSDLSRSSIAFMLPLLNGDQSLILGLTRTLGAGFAIHASFDHRVAEGLRVAQFIEELTERVQSHHRPTANNDTGAAHRLRCSACNRTMDEELKARGRGFLRMALADGSDGYVCRTCFEGW